MAQKNPHDLSFEWHNLFFILTETNFPKAKYLSRFREVCEELKIKVKYTVVKRNVKKKTKKKLARKKKTHGPLTVEEIKAILGKD